MSNYKKLLNNAASIHLMLQLMDSQISTDPAIAHKHPRQVNKTPLSKKQTKARKANKAARAARKQQRKKH